MRQNDREPRRHGDRSASRVRQATPGSRGWLDTTAVAVAVADVDSRSMIPVTALPSRILVETGGLKLCYVYGARASFTSLELHSASWNSRGSTLSTMSEARLSPSPSHQHCTNVRVFSFAPSASTFCVFGSSVYIVFLSSRRSPRPRPYPELVLSMYVRIHIYAFLALTFSSHLPRSFPHTLGDLGDPICRPSWPPIVIARLVITS